MYACDFSNGVLPQKKCDMLTECIELSDIIIDGRFEKESRDITLPLRGSTNQRVINVKKTLMNGDVTICEEYSSEVI